MVKRKQVPVVLTVAAVGVGVGVGMWLMRDYLRAQAKAARTPSKRTFNSPLDVFSTEAPDQAFEGVAISSANPRRDRRRARP